MRLVLDTNVLVSGMLVADNPPGRILDFLRGGKIQLQVDERIIAEYDGVLSRPKFRKYFSIFEKDLIMDFIREDSEWHVCTTKKIRVDSFCHLLSIHLNARNKSILRGCNQYVF